MKKLDKETVQAIAAAREAIAVVIDLIAAAHEQASEHFDGRSERWQEGAAGERYQNWMSELEDVASELESVDDRLEEIPQRPSKES